MIPNLLHWAGRFFLGGLFVYAGYTKVENPLQFAVALEAYQLLSPNSVIWVVKTLPWLEIGLGVALILGITVRYTAALAGALLTLFVVVMLVTYLRGIEADCGCFGVGERLSSFTLVRDFLFILPALYLVLKPKTIQK
jgi:putative oxidoreductase